ncbi:unnamed protein product [Miscanthus lutarioriparius]|uniref:Uncharacterized protein n=1 Tax=Miscanthus lutarioriparius TaxID=422564 RepID=A0A811M8M5_9POAL|nr:unnamed protein product [Miscanthus lutarioriparius]
MADHSSRSSISPCTPPFATPFPPLEPQWHGTSAQPLKGLDSKPQHLPLSSPELQAEPSPLLLSSWTRRQRTTTVRSEMGSSDPMLTTGQPVKGEATSPI